MPHKLVKTLQVYHVPHEVKLLLQHYFGHLRMHFTMGNFITNWQRLEFRIVTRCTISDILFAATMNVLVKSVKKPRLGVALSGGIQHVQVRAFMDILTSMARSVSENRNRSKAEDRRRDKRGEKGRKGNERAMGEGKGRERGRWRPWSR